MSKIVNGDELFEEGKKKELSVKEEKGVSFVN